MPLDQRQMYAFLKHSSITDMIDKNNPLAINVKMALVFLRVMNALG